MVKWIVDKYIFEDNRIPRESFENLGIEFFEFDYIPFLQENIKVPYTTDEAVVVYTTINAIHQLRKFMGCYYKDYDFNCNVYMSLLEVSPDTFLNHDHIYSTFNTLKEDHEYFYDLFDANELFFRPNGGSKAFTGNVFNKSDFVRELEIMEQMYNVDPSTMILISTPKNIHSESRFLIGNRKIIDASRYRVNDKHLEDRNVSQESISFVNEILDTTVWEPDNIFMLDVAETDEGPKIIELNSFSCSGWYAMNIEHVINSVTGILQEEYNEHKGSK